MWALPRVVAEVVRKCPAAERAGSIITLSLSDAPGMPGRSRAAALYRVGIAFSWRADLGVLLLATDAGKPVEWRLNAVAAWLERSLAGWPVTVALEFGAGRLSPAFAGLRLERHRAYMAAVSPDALRAKAAKKRAGVAGLAAESDKRVRVEWEAARLESVAELVAGLSVLPDPDPAPPVPPAPPAPAPEPPPPAPPAPAPEPPPPAPPAPAPEPVNPWPEPFIDAEGDEMQEIVALQARQVSAAVGAGRVMRLCEWVDKGAGVPWAMRAQMGGTACGDTSPESVELPEGAAFVAWRVVLIEGESETVLDEVSFSGAQLERVAWSGLGVFDWGVDLYVSGVGDRRVLSVAYQSQGWSGEFVEQPGSGVSPRGYGLRRVSNMAGVASGARWALDVELSGDDGTVAGCEAYVACVGGVIVAQWPGVE